MLQIGDGRASNLHSQILHIDDTFPIRIKFKNDFCLGISTKTSFAKLQKCATTPGNNELWFFEGGKLYPFALNSVDEKYCLGTDTGSELKLGTENCKQFRLTKEGAVESVLLEDDAGIYCFNAPQPPPGKVKTSKCTDVTHQWELNYWALEKADVKYPLVMPEASYIVGTSTGKCMSWIVTSSLDTKVSEVVCDDNDQTQIVELNAEGQIVTFFPETYCLTSGGFSDCKDASVALRGQDTDYRMVFPGNGDFMCLDASQGNGVGICDLSASSQSITLKPVKDQLETMDNDIPSGLIQLKPKIDKTLCLSVADGKYVGNRLAGSKLAMLECAEEDIMQTFNHTKGESLENSFAEGCVVRASDQPLFKPCSDQKVKLAKFPDSTDVFVMVNVKGVQCLAATNGTVSWKDCAWTDESQRWDVQAAAQPTEATFLLNSATTFVYYRIAAAGDDDKCVVSSQNEGVTYTICEQRKDWNDWMVSADNQIENLFGHSDSPVKQCITTNEAIEGTINKNTETSYKRQDNGYSTDVDTTVKMEKCVKEGKQAFKWLGSKSSYHVIVQTELTTTERYQTRTSYEVCASKNFWGTCTRHETRYRAWNDKDRKESATITRCLEITDGTVSLKPCAAKPTQRLMATKWS